MSKSRFASSLPVIGDGVFSDPKAGQRAAATGIQNLSFQNDSYTSAFQQFSLRSVYQPIISLPHRRIIGYEALLRTGSPMELQGPQAVFELAARQAGGLAELDRASRLLHLLNYPFMRQLDHWLFINVSQAVVEEHPDKPLLPKEYPARDWFSPRQVVLEIMEQEIKDKALLSEFVRVQRAEGFVIAVDDFGAGHSNFDRIWELQPDIVKLDRSTIVKAESDDRVRRMLPRMVSLLKESGAIVLLEGVETAKQAAIAMDSDADLVQGFYFGVPAGKLSCKLESEGHISERINAAVELEGDIGASQRAFSESCWKVFAQAVTLLEAGLSLVDIASKMPELDEGIRLYLLDEQGTQVADSVLMRPKAGLAHLRFRPLLISKGARWTRKDYFRRAISDVGRMQSSTPYLSLPDGRTCVTYSQAVQTSQGVRVLCFDVEDPDVS
jgi:EAL domain-containing protein (putative c-di-GMP-specific phosphodiesterase class I)